MNQKNSSQYGPYLVASFPARALTRICKIPWTRKYDHIASHESAWREKVSSASSHASSLELNFTFPRRGLAPDGKSRIRETLLDLDLQVRLHQPPAREKELAGGTIGLEMAVGTLVAFDGVDQAQTCHSSADALVLAVNKTASSRKRQKSRAVQV